MNRRQFITGAAAGVVVAYGGIEGSSGFAEQETFNYLKISEAPAGVWFNVRPENGDGFKDNWSAGVALMKTSPNPDVRVFDSGIVGRLHITGTAPEIAVQPNPKHLQDFRGNGVRAAAWITAQPREVIALLSIDRTLVATVQADDKGFAGVLIPDTKAEFILAAGTATTYTSDKPFIVRFGKLDAYTHPLHPSVVDAGNPDPISRLSVASVDQAPLDSSFFRPHSRGIYWSNAINLALPERSAGVEYIARDETGQFGISSVNQSTVDVYMRVNAAYLDSYRDIKDLANTHPTVWVSSSRAGTKIELLHVNRQVIPGASTLTDGVGQGGVRLPLVNTDTGIRITFPPKIAGIAQVVDLNIGPERPADRNKPSTLDATRFITRSGIYLPFDPQGRIDFNTASVAKRR